MAKERSPNYPAIGLTAALQGVRQLYEKERRSPVTTEIVAKSLGHSSLSGPATSKVAALRQYGLIEGVSPGKYRVSDDALTLLLKKPGDKDYEAAVKKAALAPSLFSELFSAYPEASEETLRYHLIKERGFSEEGATKVVKAFRDAVSVAKLTGSSYNSSGNETARVDVHASGAMQEAFEGHRTIGGEASYPLPDGMSARVVVQGGLTKRGLKKLAQNISDWADFVQDDEPRSADERRRLAELEAE